ncbi:MAG TPA: HlyD family secretion protein [Alphaproteobacteria bacterium]|nr:HlyD family secretion protein [Alphaproteobacteria bacterium]
MSEAESKLKRDPTADGGAEVLTLEPPAHATRRRVRILPFVITLATLAVGGALGWETWKAYMGAPWTRDGTVRAYVVTMAPEVTGHIVELPIADNQFVHKGDLLMVIDPTNYRIAVDSADAALKQAEANAKNAETEATRRMKLSELAVSKEEQQIYETSAIAAQAQVLEAKANLDQAQVNLERTRIVSPVNGWVTNLAAQLGDYANIGQILISLVNADSFWIDGYFEEVNLRSIREGDAATIKLMGYDKPLRGHVASIARGINVANAQPNTQGVATVNPIFTWVRLAQRIPVRIAIDELPDGITLSAGMTATVQIEPRPQPPAK